MTFEVDGRDGTARDGIPTGTKFRIEVPGGDLSNAKITNLASGEELDNVVAFQIEGDINANGGQAVVWLKLVDVDLVLDTIQRDSEIVEAGVYAQKAQREAAKQRALAQQISGNQGLYNPNGVNAVDFGFTSVDVTDGKADVRTPMEQLIKANEAARIAWNETMAQIGKDTTEILEEAMRAEQDKTDAG